MSSNNDCPTCGAKLLDETRFHAYTYRRWACGKVADDGPGASCPQDPDAGKIVQVGYEAADGVLCQRTVRASEAEAWLDENDHRRIRARAAGAQAHSEAAPAQEVALVAAPNEIAEIEKVRDGINRYMGPELEKEAMDLLASTEGITVAGHAEGPKAGREAVHSALMRLVKFRTQMVEAAHESYKGPINALGKLLDGRKKDLLRMTAEREAALKADRDAYDKAEEARKAAAAEAARLERERLERERAEEARRVLQARIQRLVDLGAVPDIAAISTATDEQFEAILDAAAEAQAAKLAQQEAERIERERLAAEQRARTELIEARTAEISRAGILPWWSGLDALASMSEDEFREKLAAAAEAEAERLRLQAAEDARRAEEQARLDKERAEIEAQLRRLDAERKERERIERAAAEAKRLEEEAEAKRVEAEAEAARLEAQRPDRERIWKWLDSLEFDLCLNGPKIEDDAVRRRWMDDVGPIVSAVQLVKLEYAL